MTAKETKRDDDEDEEKERFCFICLVNDRGIFLLWALLHMQRCPI